MPLRNLVKIVTESQGTHNEPFTPQNQTHCAYSPYCSLYISQGADKENLFNNQELLK